MAKEPPRFEVVHSEGAIYKTQILRDTETLSLIHKMCIRDSLGLATSAAGLAACTAPGAPVVTTPSTASGSTSAAASSTSTTAKPSQTTPAATASDGAWGEPDVKLGDPIGDGSQAPSPDPQPFQREIKKLAKGEKPPQFVVFSLSLIHI